MVIEKSQLRLFLTLLCLGFTSTLAFAGKTIDFKPATLIQGEKSFINLIEFPEAKRTETALIRCESWIEKNGRTFVPFCYIYDESHRVYEKAVLKHVDKARFDPAWVNGKKKRVFVSFSVLFSRDGEERKIQAFNHHFNNIDELGTDYTAPQVYKFLNYGRCYRMQQTKVKVFVSEQGKATDGEIIATAKKIGACNRKPLNALLKAKYIPAFHKDKAVAAEMIRVSGGTVKFKNWCLDCGH